MEEYKCDTKYFDDLKTYIDASELNVERIIAAGDIHGDLDLCISFLEIPKLIKRIKEEEKDDYTVKINYKDIEIRYYKWIGEKTIFVQVGDQIDRCRPTKNMHCFQIIKENDENSDIEILFMMYELNKIAKKNNCMVISLLGNHEIMNILGNINYVSRAGILADIVGMEKIRNQEDIDKEFIKKGMDLREERFKIGNSKKMFKEKFNIPEFLACSRLATVVVSDYMFIHAGVLNDLLKQTQEFKNVKSNEKREVLNIINKYIKQWLLNYVFNNKEDQEFLDKLILKDPKKHKVSLSPFWPRIFGRIAADRKIIDNDEVCKKNIKPVLDFLNIKAVIVGHTPQNDRFINSTCDNSIFRVDVAASKAFNVFSNSSSKLPEYRKPQVLEILLKNTTLNNSDKDAYNVLFENTKRKI